MGAPDTQGEAHEVESAATPDAMRIILVGRTGLDAMLRLDPSFELVRVRTALDAVGELSDPIDEHSPRKSVVIVSPEADPDHLPAAGKADAGDFIAALRRLDPAVRILKLENGEANAQAGPYDGIISASPTPSALRDAVRGDDDADDTLPAVTVTAGKKGPDKTSLVDTMLAGKKPGAGVMSAVGDEPMVQLLLQGRDITDAAIEIIRKRLAGDAAFVSSGRTGRERIAEAADGAHEAAVSWRGRLLGRLRSRDVPPEKLAPHAAWLASWLAIRDQHVHLRDAAFTDSLTGAYNRRFFDHFIGPAIRQARKDRRALTVLVFDLDNFKQYNDLYGHAQGDEILIETVRLMRSVIRPTDKVCRMGGDEFVVIFYEPEGPRNPSSRPPNTVFEIAQRFQREIASHRFPKLGRDAPGHLTVSGGLATYPWDGATADELLARADELALQSKRQGKNAITLGPGAEREHNGA